MIDIKTITLCLNFLIIGVCESAYVDSIEKCGIKDFDCQSKLFSKTFEAQAAGIPELGIPQMDPYIIKDMAVSILDVIKFTIIDGTLEGISSCKFTSIEINVEKKVLEGVKYCDRILINVQYEIESSPFIKLFTKQPISGKGNGKIEVDKVAIDIRLPFNIDKKDDGDIYILPVLDQIKYDTASVDKITFDVDNIMLGTNEISKVVVPFLNSNWKSLMSTFGKMFTDKGMDVYFGNVNKFFSQVPVKHYISDDLSQYIKN